MRIEIKRFFKGEKYTIGRMYIDGIYFCDTLEDKVRAFTQDDPKVWGETAIPEGIYRCTVTYSPKFKRELPYLHNVPYFTGIRIHRGNTHVDTAGCILVGENKMVGKVINSTKYELELTKLIKEVGSCTVHII